MNCNSSLGLQPASLPHQTFELLSSYNYVSQFLNIIHPSIKGVCVCGVCVCVCVCVHILLVPFLWITLVKTGSNSKKSEQGREAGIYCQFLPCGSHKSFHSGQALSGCSPDHLWVRCLYLPLTPSGLQVIIKPSLTKPGGLHQPLMISLHFALLFTNNPLLKLSLILTEACWDPD